ncbi:hypothetical protein [Streptomyces sp. NBRC 109706]|uniref:hypothetical protein n=1 Tax=Streptomyces sp. NBRC 109706 TaxID=1550035 RepID=UPI0007852230|nr:hypothetical protein [Streptomyces sp. NBRC 109706]
MIDIQPEHDDNLVAYYFVDWIRITPLQLDGAPLHQHACATPAWAPGSLTIHHVEGHTGDLVAVRAPLRCHATISIRSGGPPLPIVPSGHERVAVETWHHTDQRTVRACLPNLTPSTQPGPGGRIITGWLADNPNWGPAPEANGYEPIDTASVSGSPWRVVVTG